MKKFLAPLIILLLVIFIGVSANASSFLDTLDKINDTMNTVDRTEYTFRRVKNKVPDVDIKRKTRSKVITVPVNNNNYKNQEVIQQNTKQKQRKKSRQKVDYSYENNYPDYTMEQPVNNQYEQNNSQENDYNSTSSYTIPKSSNSY